MKKKINFILFLLILIPGLFACGETEKTENVSIIEDSEVVEDIKPIEDSEDIIAVGNEEISEEEYLYYHIMSLKLEEFYTNYSNLGNSIDNFNEDDYTYYLTKLQENVDYIENSREPFVMDKAKDSIVNGLNKYIEAGSLLKSAFSTIDNDLYLKYYDKVQEASNENEKFLLYLNNEKIYNYSSYLSSIMETNYYLSQFNLYSRTSLFTDSENEFLYTINHSLLAIPSIVNNSVIALYEGNDYISYLNEFDNILLSIESLEIENENLKNYKEDVLTYTTNYKNYISEYLEQLENGGIETITDKNIEISENAKNLYNSMEHMSMFYEEKGISIDFLKYETMETTDTLDEELIVIE